MSKKDFTKSTATKNLFAMFGLDEEGKSDPGTGSQTEPAKKIPKAADENQAIPKGYVLKEEPKSQRLQLLLKASTFKELKELSGATGESVNAICNKAIENYLKGATK